MVLFQWRRWKRAHFHIHIFGLRIWQAGGQTPVARVIHDGFFWEDGTAVTRRRDTETSAWWDARRGVAQEGFGPSLFSLSVA